MEKSIGGSGYRPSINSYMFGDAAAIAVIAAMAGDREAQGNFLANAAKLRLLIQKDLWNPRDQFFETVPRNETGHWVNTRELIGYIPWYFGIPDHRFDIAWKQLFQPDGFAGRYGPTTAERRDPRYRFSDRHECLWNGPSWPFATTQTLVAMAHLLQDGSQAVLTSEDYYRLLSTYTSSQQLRLAESKSIRWIDEDLDADTGEWIARNILAARAQLPRNRGRYYNHSGYADLIITGLLGLLPAADSILRLRPLLPPSRAEYFMISGLPYRGHLLTVSFDHDGRHYGRGKGLQVYSGGRLIGTSPTLGNLDVQLARL